MTKNPRSFQGKVVIITGASSGIGEGVAYRLAREGMRLTLAARRQDRLEMVAARARELGGEVLTFPLDVRDREAILQMVQATLERWGRVDILVNNAGIGYPTQVVNIDPEKLRNILDVNILSVIECAQAVLPAMISQSSGHIINVSSLASFVGLPKSSIYCATKFAVNGFSEGLRREVKRKGIYVTTFCPGFVATHFSPRLKKIAENSDDAPFIPGVMSVEYVANKIAWVIRHPKRRVAIPRAWRLLSVLANLFPGITDYILSVWTP